MARKTRRRKNNEELHLKVLVAVMLLFSYALQPYMPESQPTFAHAYYVDLFGEFYGTLSQTHDTSLKFESEPNFDFKDASQKLKFKY